MQRMDPVRRNQNHLGCWFDLDLDLDLDLDFYFFSLSRFFYSLRFGSSFFCFGPGLGIRRQTETDCSFLGL